MGTKLRKWWRRLWMKDTAPSVGEAVASMIPPPRELPDEVVAEGDASHPHCFHRAEWDTGRLGPPAVNFDKYVPGAFCGGFPMCTFKELHRCGCGREIVTAVRALI